VPDLAFDTMNHAVAALRRSRLATGIGGNYTVVVQIGRNS
jgi:hypothetical protein